MIQVWRVLLLCASSLLTTPIIAQSLESSPPIRVLVAYHSISGHTERMAEAVALGAQMVDHTHVVVKRVGQVTAEDLVSADAIVLGSPVYWANMAGEVKSFIDDWQFKFGVFPEFKLTNKVGAAFATGGQISGGKELTMLSILAAMLGNYMIVVSGGGAFGASATTRQIIAEFGLRENGCCGRCARNIHELVSLAKNQLERACHNSVSS